MSSSLPFSPTHPVESKHRWEAESKHLKQCCHWKCRLDDFSRPRTGCCHWKWRLDDFSRPRLAIAIGSAVETIFQAHGWQLPPEDPLRRFSEFQLLEDLQHLVPRVYFGVVMHTSNSSPALSCVFPASAPSCALQIPSSGPLRISPVYSLTLFISVPLGHQPLTFHSPPTDVKTPRVTSC